MHDRGPVSAQARFVIEIRPFENLLGGQPDEAARVLMLALAHAPAAYHTIEEARAEVAKVSNSDRLGFAALLEDRLVGWIGAIKTYDQGWELHPLVVDPAHQRSGIGLLLIRTLEGRARSEGVLTLYLGADDDFAGTSLFGAELYPDPLTKLAAIKPTT